MSVYNNKTLKPVIVLKLYKLNFIRKHKKSRRLGVAWKQNNIEASWQPSEMWNLDWNNNPSPIKRYTCGALSWKPLLRVTSVCDFPIEVKSDEKKRKPSWDFDPGVTRPGPSWVPHSGTWKGNGCRYSSGALCWVRLDWNGEVKG